MIKGIIFDMDGVISDTQRLHAQVESELLARYGIMITPADISRRYAGVRTAEFFDQLLRRQKLPYNLEALLKEKWERMEKLAAISVAAIDGALDLIKNLYAAKYVLAVVSSSSSRYVNLVLTNLEVNNYFTSIISSDLVEKGKPDPAGFLLAAARIKAIPSECLVIEDGASGMEAARRAGMACIGLVSREDRKYPTENLVRSLTEITPDYLKQITPPKNA